MYHSVNSIMVTLLDLTSLGTKHQPFSVANKVKMMNSIALFTTIISALYTLTYALVLNELLVASINLLFTLAYIATLLLNRQGAIKEAKIWFFVILMLHLWVCTNMYVTKESGFHLYYFLVPTGAFLLFELDEKFTKLWLSCVAVVLFLICENNINTAPLIQLTDEMNQAIYQSVVLVNMVEVIWVMTIFVSQIEKNEKKLFTHANTDVLTGIANRRFLFDQAQPMLDNCIDHKRPLSIALLDFDNFKTINDRCGHAVGDRCLIEVIGVINRTIRDHDIFARIGGEEFVIVMNDTTLSEANNLAEKIRCDVQQHKISIDQQSPVNCTISIGVSCNNDEDSLLTHLLSKADKALYSAKSRGRNRVHLFSAT